MGSLALRRDDLERSLDLALEGHCALRFKIASNDDPAFLNVSELNGEARDCFWGFLDAQFAVDVCVQ